MLHMTNNESARLYPRTFTIRIIVVFLIAVSTVRTQPLSTDVDSVAAEPPAIDPPVIAHNAFDVGEKLTFKIRYGFIRAGTAEMKVMDRTRYNGEEVYHIQTTARSVSAFDWFYKVRDVVNTYMDARGLYPYRYEKILREGGYKADLFVDFFHLDSLAKVEFKRYDDGENLKKRKEYDVKIPPFSRDVLSAFYYVRTRQLYVGDPIQLTSHEKDSVYNMEVKIYKRETIEVEAGKFRCLKVEPLLQGEGIFKQKGRLLIWLTDDELKIPVQMKSKVVVGHITSELKKIEGVNRPIPAQLN